ncbi:MAG: SAM-dependent methyltransferase [Cyclobacteriaceae bacterium]|nr:SAM-dependent methyltransferase [Cyclobacteriaceae bacterium]
MNELERWIEALKASLEKEEFIKLTLSKPKAKSDLSNVYGKWIALKEEPHLSLTYHHTTKDVIKNYKLDEGIVKIKDLLSADFKIGTLFTAREDVVLRISKKGKMLVTSTAASQTVATSETHDKQKRKRALEGDTYLTQLGIADAQGQIIPKMADKFRQINKYLEVMEELIKSANFPAAIRIVDMGAGKGYLTFALYDYLRNKLHHDVRVTGVELRQDLVDKCNNAAKACGFDQLHFVCSSIEDYALSEVDILIALHACDTATDDAIAKGIKANAALIVCAPCCHKQIRQQLKGKEHKNPILKYGIYKEREFEIVTDTIRALVLERNSYKSNIFEFISSEHTRKNTMLVGVRSKHKPDIAAIQGKIDSLKETYQIDYHYLEKIII